MGIHDHISMYISSGTPDDLEERRSRSEKTYFLRIEYPDERYFGEIKSFSEEIYTDDSIDFSET
jgi:hypothetical protein